MEDTTTYPKTNHIKSVINKIRSAGMLPFTELLPISVIKKHLAGITYRNRIFTPELTLFGLLLQAIGADQSCQAATCRIIACLLGKEVEPPSANTSAYSQARSRLPEAMVSGLARENAHELEEEADPAWLWRGKHVKLIDGSTFSMPDTPANQEAYPQQKSQKEGVGFPIARMVGVISLATGAVLDMAVGPWSGKGTGEHALLRQILDVFSPGDVALGDRYYASFFLIATLMGMGIDVVFPIHASRDCDFRRGKRLGKRDHIVQWKKPARPKWMDKETYDAFPATIDIRELSVSTGMKGFRKKKRVLVTTLLDAAAYSREDLTALYDCRWFVEISLRSIKETMCMEILRAKTPQMIRKEMWARLLAYNLIRKIMAQSAGQYDKVPRFLSFKCSMQLIFAFSYSGCGSEQACQHLLKSVSRKAVGNRPGRSEPRVVKRRPKPFPKMQKPRNAYPRKVA